MKTFRELDVYPRILLIVMLVMLLAFSVAYPLTISRVGFQYRGAILVPQVQEIRQLIREPWTGKKRYLRLHRTGQLPARQGTKPLAPISFGKTLMQCPQICALRREALPFTKEINCGSAAVLRI